jgi:hypothetical protein
MQTHRSSTEIIIKSEPCEQQQIWYRTVTGQAEVFQLVQWTVESSSAFPIQIFQTTPCSGVDVVVPGPWLAWVEKVQSAKDGCSLAKDVLCRGLFGGRPTCSQAGSRPGSGLSLFRYPMVSCDCDSVKTTS